MKILVIGSGGREHALCDALKASAEVVCSPGNAGIADDVPCIELKSHSDIATYCAQQKIDLVVVGPEQPLVDGLADSLRLQHQNGHRNIPAPQPVLLQLSSPPLHLCLRQAHLP